MTKTQRYRYEMFVRVRDFGLANRDLFPESSKGGQTFAEVAAAVTAVEDHLTKRDLARVEARRVKATTRAAVFDYMKVIARTGRRVTMDEPSLNPFALPARKTAAALLSTARLFIEEARPREAQFVDLGLPPDFISEFSALVEQLVAAVNARLNGRALRLKAQTGIENALVVGFEVIQNLDVLVPNALRDDPVRLGHWRGARRIEGLGSSSSDKAKTEPETVPLDPSSVNAATAPEPASPPAADEATSGNVTTVEAPALVLEKAS